MSRVADSDIQSFDGRDMTPVLRDNLLKPLLANAKSQNEAIRDGAASAFRALSSLCFAESGIHSVRKSLLDVLSQSKVVPERQCVAAMLESTPNDPKTAPTTFAALTKIASKETSDVALASEVNALLSSAECVTPDDAALQIVADAIAKGMKDKKTSVRRAWSLTAADYVWRRNSLPDEQKWKDTISVAALSTLQGSFEETLQNPLAAAQNGLVVQSYILTALSSNDSPKSQPGNPAKHNSPTRHALSSPDSFLLNSKAYTKIEGVDVIWLVRALSACASGLAEATSSTQHAWASAFMYTISANDLPEVRRTAAEHLTDAYLQNRAVVGGAVVQAMWNWYRDTAHDRKESAVTKLNPRRLVQVLRCTCPPAEAAHITLNGDSQRPQEAQLVRLLVLCRPEIIFGAHWIDLCLRSSLDPGLLVQRNLDDCLRRSAYPQSLRQTIRDGWKRCHG